MALWERKKKALTKWEFIIYLCNRRCGGVPEQVPGMVRDARIRDGQFNRRPAQLAYWWRWFEISIVGCRPPTQFEQSPAGLARFPVRFRFGRRTSRLVLGIWRNPRRRRKRMRGRPTRIRFRLQFGIERWTSTRPRIRASSSSDAGQCRGRSSRSRWRWWRKIGRIGRHGWHGSVGRSRFPRRNSSSPVSGQRPKFPRLWRAWQTPHSRKSYKFHSSLKGISLIPFFKSQYVVNVTPNLPNVFEDSGTIQYLQIPITDHWSQNLASFFPSAIGFIGNNNHVCCQHVGKMGRIDKFCRVCTRRIYV